MFAVFRTLKEHWKKKVHEWRISNLEAPILKKKDFPELLKEVIDTTLNATIFENGFRKCGLFPWHPEIVTVPLNNEDLHNQVTNVEGRRRFLEEGLRFLNQSIPQSKLIIFCNGDKNELDEKDISLFELWQSTKSEIENGLPNSSVVIPEPTAENSEDTNLLFNIIPLASGGNNEWQNQSTAHNNRPSKNNSPTIFEPYFENNMNLCQAGPSSAPADFPSPFAPDALTLASGAICQAGPSSAPAVFPSPFAPDALPLASGVISECNNETIETSVSAEIPSPFKRHFYYKKNKEEPDRKRCTKERMPSIVSGHLCQEYFKKKLAKKEELEKLKMERAAKRQKKREENEKTKKGNIQKRKKTLKRGCLILTIVLIQTWMVFLLTVKLLLFRQCRNVGDMWPEKVDQLDYEWEYVLFHIDEPLKMSQTRNVYSVPELEYLWN
ncbi:unnamed protein product [Pieris macdunnoughi]|uniref:Uncharacterized protein n=1 Tax=Pieris macdunnoughi TaxID=345717 RepID=A0A821XTL7_9NEOP|nr:unnamed protein product [Pieris macdunnoughi]